MSNSNRTGYFSRIAWILLAVSIGAAACSPRHFVASPSPPWKSVAVRPGISFDRVWDQTVDLLVRHFDIAVLSKSDGYIRTEWLYRWTGKVTEDYRVRVTVKFTPDRTRCDLRAEAEYGGPDEWVLGFDQRLERELLESLQDRIGRGAIAGLDSP